MRIKNCSREDLDAALYEVNKQFGNNIYFTDSTPEWRAGSNRGWRVRLGVKDCHGPGTHITVRYDDPFGKCEQKIRRSHSACWHVHGVFFDALPDGTSINSRGVTTHPCDLWEDFNIGSIVLPVYASESCICMREVDPEWAKSDYEKARSWGE